MVERKARQRKCKCCGERYTPVRPLQTACGLSCAIKLGKMSSDKQERAKTRQKRESLKSRSDWMKDAQKVFNRYIRLRDARLPCISCGRHHTGQYHAGHYLTVGARPELRFEELNVHKQCAPCNDHLSGNIALYRINLIKKIGIDNVEWLEGKHESKKYTIDEIKEIISTYKQKIKEMK